MLLVSTLQQFDIELANFLAIVAALGLFMLLVPAVLSAPMLAVITESITPRKNRSFYSKCARHLCQSAFGAGLPLFTILGTGAAIALLQYQPELMSPPLIWRTLVIFAIPSATLLLLGIYLGSWNRLKQQRRMHLFLGYLAGFSCLALLLLCFLFLGSVLRPLDLCVFMAAPGETLSRLSQEFFNTPLLWLLAAYLLLTGLAAGAGITQIWLIIRRHKEDYGRDYYNFAMHYCARLSLAFILSATVIAGTIIVLCLQGHFPPAFTQPQDRGMLLVSFGLPVSCFLLWLCILKSDTPMRHKPGAFFACLFLYLALYAQLLFFMSTFPMI